MLQKILFLATALLLCGCAPQVTPLKLRPAPVDKLSQKGAAKLYLCKDDKVVRVVQNQPKKKSNSKLSQVTVTFNQMSEKLLLGISERGQNYTNVRWSWLQREDYSTLTTTVGVVLAEQCVLQRGEPSAD